MKYLELEDINAYSIAFQLSNYVWCLVMKWNNFAKYTVGEQFVKAIDSISANISEGFGRYTKRDKIRFYRISMGSLKECLDWIEKAKVRNLLNENEYIRISADINILPREINSLIKYTDSKLKY